MTCTNVLPLLLAGIAGCLCQAQAADGLACNLKALTQSERVRHQELGRQWHSAVADRRELSDGYAFRIDPSKTSVVELAEWVAYEQKCCPFFRFRIEVDETGTVWMTLSGRAGVKQFIASEFNLSLNVSRHASALWENAMDAPLADMLSMDRTNTFPGDSNPMGRGANMKTQ